MPPNTTNSVAQEHARVPEDRDGAGEFGKCKSDQLNFF